MKIRSNSLLAAAVTTAAMLCPAGASAQDFPSKPMRIITGFVPGSTGDLIARLLGGEMSPILGLLQVIDDK